MDPLSILEQKAKELKIEVGWLKLNRYTPPSASYKYMKIAMNSNWHNPNETVFQLAHEIAHIINQDDCIAFYHASYASQERIEREANVEAIKLLVPIFFDMGYKRNVIKFMQVFHIPNYLFDNVYKIMESN